MAKTRIAREVDEILASKPRHDSTARGEEAFRNIQSEARAAESAARMADLTQTIAAQRSPCSAHALVQQSEMYAEQAARYVAFAQAWVLAARGTPQFAAVERVLASVRGTVSRAKAHAASTKKAFEKHFGKYDPRGVRDHATKKNKLAEEDGSARPISKRKNVRHFSEVLAGDGTAPTSSGAEGFSSSDLQGTVAFRGRSVAVRSSRGWTPIESGPGDVGRAVREAIFSMPNDVSASELRREIVSRRCGFVSTRQ